jgi:cyclomaltodextrin glucanotransferase
MKEAALVGRKSSSRALSFLFALSATLCAGALPNARAQEAQNAGSGEGRDYRSRTVYFAMTDRFHAHDPYEPYVDPQYPTATNTVDCFAVACTTEVQYRSFWGGDISGFIQKLDYLQDMGIGATWLTPMYEGVRDYESGIGYGTDYHGYWVTNYDRVNPHFGTWRQVKELSNALHQHGMRYIQDITLNDSNPNDAHVFGRLYRGTKADRVLIDSYANDFDFSTGMHFYKHFDSDPRCIQELDVPDGQQTYWQLHHCSLGDLSGYNQYNETIANYLIDAGKLWLANGVDDFRLDAVKYPFPEFIAAFSQSMIEDSTRLGRHVPYFVGEWSSGGAEGDPKSLAFANHYDVFHTNILDFQLALRLNQYVGGAAEDPTQQFSAQELAAYLAGRVSAFDGRDDWQGTFIDNHDQMRTLVRLHKLGLSAEDSDRRLDLATVLLMTVRGIPIIMWGDEQYLAYDADNANPPPAQINGWGDDPWNRVGMMSFSENTVAFRIIKILAKLRQDTPAIQQGAYTTLYADQDALVFRRQLGSESVVVAVNRGAAKQITVPLSTDLRPGSYQSLLAPDQGVALVVTPTRLQIQLPAMRAVVARLK